jgi:hypothetical protein
MGWAAFELEGGWRGKHYSSIHPNTKHQNKALATDVVHFIFHDICSRA